MVYKRIKLCLTWFSFAASSDKDCDINVKDDNRLSFRRRKGSSLDRSYRTLPRHLERGKNLSKRFRKSCRNWATAKGLLNNNTKEDSAEKKKDNDTTDVDDNEDNDIVVIDLEEDPELKYKAASETDIGQLVADLVRDARRNNTLPRSRSRAVNDPEVSSLNKSLSAISIVDNDDTTQAQIDTVASPSILNNETEEEEEHVKTNDEDTKSTTSAEVLETSFDETIQIPPTSEERDQEPDESIGESSFYNGIMQATEFHVTAKFSKELFKEETAGSLESSQVDQDGFTDLNKVNTELDENCERKEKHDNNLSKDEDTDEPDDKESNLEETRENHGEENESTVDKTDTHQFIEQPETIENNAQEPVENTDSIESYPEEDHGEESDDRDTVTESDEDTECEEEEAEHQDFFKETGNIVRSQLIDEDEEEEGFRSDQYSRGLLDDDSDNEFESIAKISALDFLNDEDDADEVTEIVTNGSTNYFSSSFLFNHPVFTKESSFPSLKLDKEDNNSCSPYLEAINLEMDGKETSWNPFRYSSVELRVNPMYKDEDSLNSNNSMNNSLISTDGKIQQFNNNLQEFFDLWDTFSKDQDDEETTIMHHQESNCSLLFHNLEAIQEEDESEEDSEVDENNNNCDNSDSETDEEIAAFTMSGHENIVTVCDTPKHDLIVFTKNNHENRVDRELCNSEGYSDIFKIDPDLFEYVHVKEQNYQSVELENYVAELLKSILDKVLEPEGNEKLIVEDSGSLIDEFDDEYYSCDSPDDLRSEPGSGVSTDEGIDATDDDEDDIEHKNNQYNHKLIDIVRHSPTQL